MTGRDLGILFGAGLPLLVALVGIAEWKGAFRNDRFPSPVGKVTALGLLFLLLVASVLLPAAADGTAVDTSSLSFSGIFGFQLLLLAFLALWWLLAGRPPLLDFLGLRSRRPLLEAGAGICLGVIGWALTFVFAVAAYVVMTLLDLPTPRGAPPLVTWLAGLAAWQRGLVVLSAMTVEELYFRAFLQKRLGAVAASLLFLLAHGGYGEPFLFVGLAAITTVLAAAYAYTKSTVAPIVAHGVFNAIQLFVIIPWALKLAGR